MPGIEEVNIKNQTCLKNPSIDAVNWLCQWMGNYVKISYDLFLILSCQVYFQQHACCLLNMTHAFHGKIISAGNPWCTIRKQHISWLIIRRNVNVTSRRTSVKELAATDKLRSPAKYINYILSHRISCHNWSSNRPSNMYSSPGISLILLMCILNMEISILMVSKIFSHGFLKFENVVCMNSQKH
jgi:hypothetical protein